MGSRSLKNTLMTATDTLLSLRTTKDQHTAALAQLETLVASLVFDPQHPLLATFLRFQDSFDRNITTTLLEWLGRELARGEHPSSAWTSIVRCLKLVQGLLLLHRPSQRLFARKSSLEYLLGVLDMSRPDHPRSPLLSSPKPASSPVLFPPSPSSSPNLASATALPALPTTRLALAALDTLLCALVDRPKNMRRFEEIGGLSAIVKVLKDKNVPQPVRIKVVELLYYYLLPEANSPLSPGPPSPDSSFSSLARSTLSNLSSRVLADATNLPTLFASAANFVPQTPPVRPLHVVSRFVADKDTKPSDALSLAEHGVALVSGDHSDPISTKSCSRTDASSFACRIVLVFTPRTVLTTSAITAAVNDGGRQGVCYPPRELGHSSFRSAVFLRQLLARSFSSTFDTPARTVNHIAVLLSSSLLVFKTARFRQSRTDPSTTSHASVEG
ncbi:hypothetical protein JCM10295v2_001215 [Rhodotorula toruloides]